MFSSETISCSFVNIFSVIGRGLVELKPEMTSINKAEQTICSRFADMNDLCMMMTCFKSVLIVNSMWLKVFCQQHNNMIKYLILIISVSLLITSVGGLLLLKNSSSVEVNETIVNYKSFNGKTMESNKETALEHRLADVL